MSFKAVYKADEAALVLADGKKPEEKAESVSKPYGKRRQRTGGWGRPFPLTERDGKFYPRKAVRLKDGDVVCVIPNWVQGSVKRLDYSNKK